VRTNLFIQSRFWTTETNFDTCCLRYIATCGKFFLCRCPSTFSALNLNYCSGFFFFKSLSYLYEVVRTNFSADFFIFAFFDVHFSEFVAPPTKENENYVVHLKEQSLLKKSQKPCRNRPINGNAMLVRTMHPSNARCSRLAA